MGVEETEKEILDIEMAHFVLLSLYREYSIQAQNNPQEKKNCFDKMRQIKNDLKYLAQKELLEKVKEVYQPVLLKMKG